MDTFSLYLILTSNLHFLLSEILFLLIRLCGINIFRTTATKQSTITKYILRNFYTRSVKELPFGLIICYEWQNPFIGYASCTNTTNYSRFPSLCLSLDVICSNNTWNIISASDKISDLDTQISISNACNMGDSRIIRMKKLTPWASQTLIIDAIMKSYARHKFATIVISGDTCTGKSAVAYILAQKLKTTITTNAMFNQLNALDDVFQSNEPSYDFPVIALVDEFDQMINLTDSPVEKSNKDDFSRMLRGRSDNIATKKSWNEGLDKINMGLYPFMIWILTTNKSREEIEQGDKSLFRSGRVNLFINTSLDSGNIKVNIVDQDKQD